ncbi:LacI family DNA-binding transcriptional regulator [Ensifer sp. ENS07]|uniref:LacI family DNA-binding transcriptional regulator n=1 Tax=Ensifer TaxID=106591 RepID=UPI000727BC36|nr:MULTISPECIES: LacI family DNA-binding transcriptional regulator [Ensifer]KSV77250.1 LacI family transcriptional regulator [Sinorhizobium sp. GW3]MBD9639532.1 LacI family DNA-binding transcriptional regulator [Ensifer sp. ENS07]MBW0368510.1 LacI family transcriptional regulator [Ensifer adhaerens]OKP76703.1 LacI family transcriptional regulator [Ensifer adhaerens]RAS14646.1 LacI family transcriptional regulator [Ensifer adhaerens]
MSDRPKIKDIAERAGVSVATVSRALSGSSLVTDETRQRINALARELNYRPNVSARNLRTRRSMSVLLVVRDVGNPFYLEILKGVEATAREAGYAVLMGNTENDPDREVEYFNMLRDGHADGMILMTGKLPPPEPGESADLSHLPVVIALEMIEGSGFPHVQIDNVAAAEAAVDHLIALGHRRIAHIAGPLPEVMALRRRDGYRAAMKAAGLAVPEGYEVRGDYLLESGEACASDLFALPEPPTAIFAANDEMAYGAIHALRRLGRDVPGDVSVVGFDDLYLSKAFYPPLTTVSQPRADIGRTAMSQLLNVLSDGDVAAEPAIVLPTTLNIRGSTAPPRK